MRGQRGSEILQVTRMRGVYVEYSYSTSGICFVGDAEKQEISFF